MDVPKRKNGVTFMGWFAYAVPNVDGILPMGLTVVIPITDSYYDSVIYDMQSENGKILPF